MGIPQVVFASKPFLTSFIQQTGDLGVRDYPMIVIDAETCHPAPVRRQIRRVLDLLPPLLTRTEHFTEPEVHWAPADEEG